MLAGATLVALVLLGLYWLDMSGWGRRAIEIERLPQHALDYRVAPNRANWVEWAQLPGLGEVLSKRIVEDCNQNGPFRTADDLLRVRGIGPKKLEAIRPFLDFPSTPTANDDPQTIGVIPSQPKR